MTEAEKERAAVETHYRVNRVLGAICAALVAVSFARALDVPFWGPVGDQCDIGVLTFLAALFLSRGARGEHLKEGR